MNRAIHAKFLGIFQLDLGYVCDVYKRPPLFCGNCRQNPDGAGAHNKHFVPCFYICPFHSVIADAQRFYYRQNLRIQPFSVVDPF